MNTYTQRGGATVRGTYASWPFGKIVVDPGRIRLSVLASSIALTPADIISIWVEGPGWWRAGLTFAYRTPMLGQSVTFESSRLARLIVALREAGFAVQERGGGFTK